MQISILYRPLIILLLCCIFPVTLIPQEETSQQSVVPDTALISKVEQKVNTIQDLLDNRKALNDSISQLKKQLLKKNITDGEKAEYQKQEEQLNHELEQVNESLIVISSGIDPRSFEAEPPVKDIDINKDIEELIYPIIDDIKSFTIRPREIESLKSDLVKNENRLASVADALSKLSVLVDNSDNKEVQNYLNTRVSYWTEKDDELKKEREAIILKLEEKEGQKQDFFQVLKDIANKFFRSHGKNLLLAILGLLTSFFLLRFLHRWFRKRVRVERFKNWRLMIRIIDLLYYIFTVLVSLSFFIIVLMSASDWLLLGLSLFIIFGLLWVTKSAIPSFIEQAKLMLDLGAVREGERVIYNNVPYKVDSISMYSYLVNPEMNDSQIILPLKDLIDMRSRPFSESEHWFPSALWDWVKLDDGFYGQVISQTPDTVVLLVDRGSTKMYTTSDYLANNPQNMTRLGFAIEQIIGIDYEYRYVVNEYLCDKLHKYLSAKLHHGEYKDFIEFVQVELEEMNNSSIDIEVVIKFSGGAAYDFIELPGRINQIMLDALNELEIAIPYPHITLDGLPGPATTDDMIKNKKKKKKKEEVDEPGNRDSVIRIR